MLGYHGKVTRVLSSVAVGGALLLAVGGCARENENTQLVVGPDSVVVLAPLTAPSFLLPPEGVATASSLVLVSFDPVALDAFGRTNEPFQRSEWPHYRSSGYWRWGINDPDGNQWNTALTDPRLPALTRTTPLEDPWRMYIAVQGVFASDGYDIYGEWCCLTPGTDYVAGFERSWLKVNGELDASQVLLGQTVDQPDELAWLGGQPGGSYTRRADLFNTGAAYPSEANANPFLFGLIAADPADGYVVLDVVVSCYDAAGVQRWMCDATPNQSLSVVAPNLQVRHTFPNYNYITIWELNPDGTPNFSRPVLRKQLGTDLTELGGPINNSYAPFPLAALSDAELAQGTGGVSLPDSMTLELENLAELAGSNVYKVWAIMADGSTMALPFDYLNTIETETGIDTIASATDANGFSGGPGVHEVIVDYPDGAAFIMLSIESSAGATSASAAQMLWAKGLQGAGEAKSLVLPVEFGTFGERLWAISGTGNGGLFGNEFRERYQQLPRPPVGYKYVTWLASGDSLFDILPDGSFTSGPPDYTPLTDADVDMSVSPVVQPGQLVTAFSRICLIESTATACPGPFNLGAYDTFILTLEPKAGVMSAAGPTRVLEALTPTPRTGI